MLQSLENNLGVSWNKIKSIIRRADVNRNGIIDYKTFLETLKQYRLTTEQETKLKGAVRAFAYAEEFTCSPPTIFMILGNDCEFKFIVNHDYVLPYCPLENRIISSFYF